MSYMLLIMEPRGQRAARSAIQGREVYERMLAYAAALKQRGVLLAANALKRDALRLSMEQGRAQVLDGPFTESKELIGGYFLIDCATRDEALAIARDCPPRRGRASKCGRSAPATSKGGLRPPRYICAAQALHQPAAFTSLPAKIWHGP